MKSLSVKITVIALLFVLIFASCSANNVGTTAPELLQPASLPVDIVEVTRGNVEQLSIFEGVVTARTEELRFKAVDSTVSKIYCNQGDYVTAGTLLAEMDKTVLNSQIEMYSSMLEMNEATWTHSNIQMEVQIQRSRDYGSTALADEQQRKLDYDIQSQQIERERLQFKIDSLRARESDYEIIAPFDGIVTHIASTYFLSPRGAFIWLSDMNDLSIQCTDSTMRESLVTATRVTADLGAGEQELEFIPYSSQELLAFSLENKTPPSNFRLVNGTLTTESRILIKVYGNTRENVIMLIPNAIHDDSVTVDGVVTHNRFVYVDENGASTRREITTGLSSNVAVEITSGLEEGDKVYVQEN